MLTCYHALHTCSLDFHIARGFALSLWEMLLESAVQFGCEVA